jgi:hypothetical protein
VRKFLIVLSLWLGLTAGGFAAETWTLTDGTSVSGEIVKSDDNGVMVHNTADAYNNISWAQFSQDSLKHLADNPKFKPYVEPFIEPTASERPAKPAIRAPTVTRPLQPPDKLRPSILGGLVQSSLGLFILLVIYAANLYAAFEIAVVRSRPIGVVMGVAAVLPIIGPILFLSQPVEAPAAAEEAAPAEGAPGGTPAPAPGAAPAAGQPGIEIVAASWQGSKEEKKPQPQIFSRGKFTLNRRFIETKFAGFIGEPKDDAKNYSMEIRTLKNVVPVEIIKQVAASELIVETPNGQVTVPYSDIQEIKLIPKPA